jgi:ATP-dependent DNA helicase RecQ
LELRKQEFSISKESKREKKSTKTPEKSLTKPDLFDALKELRNKIAREKRLPSYIVFNDKSLQDMCAIMPRDNSDFLMVHGVGQNKLENYGAAFLELIKNF